MTVDDLYEKVYGAHDEMRKYGEGYRGEPKVDTQAATSDAVSHPSYYVFPNGAETIQISQWLSSAGGQAVQYIVRATRIDGVVKENPVEDIDKAIFWLQTERKRLAHGQ